MAFRVCKSAVCLRNRLQKTLKLWSISRDSNPEIQARPTPQVVRFAIDSCCALATQLQDMRAINAAPKNFILVHKYNPRHQVVKESPSLKYGLLSELVSILNYFRPLSKEVHRASSMCRCLFGIDNGIGKSMSHKWQGTEGNFILFRNRC